MTNYSGNIPLFCSRFFFQHYILRIHMLFFFFFFFPQRRPPVSTLLQGHCPSAGAVRLFFDADPFPVKVRFLLFQGNRRPESRSFSLFLFPLKEEVLLCFIFCYPHLPPLLWDKSGMSKKKKNNKSPVGQVLISETEIIKRERSLKRCSLPLRHKQGGDTRWFSCRRFQCRAQSR